MTVPTIQPVTLPTIQPATDTTIQPIGKLAIVKQPDTRTLNGSGSDISFHHRAQPIQPRPTPAEIYVEKARAALVKGHLLYPEDDSALYWARRAKMLNPQNGTAIQIEQLILDQSVQAIQNDRKAKKYNAARTQLAILESLFPNRADLERLRYTILSEQRQEDQKNAHR